MPPAPRGTQIDLVALAGITSGYPAGFIPRCPKCRYDLTGLKRSRCPECGAAFSIPQLLDAWRTKKGLGPGDVDFLLGALFVLPAAIPANLGDPSAPLWKLPVLAALWLCAWVWYKRRAAALREETDAHRLMWVWVPCAATALGLSPTPTLNLWVAGAMLILALTAMFVAWRRSPAATSLIVTLSLVVPCVLLCMFATFLIVDGINGSAQGAFWSQTDYPGWYWRGVPGRVRGINNADAVRLGAAMLAVSIPALGFTAGLWLLVARRWRRAGASPAPVVLRAGSLPRRKNIRVKHA